jgi:hypothetical protein
MSTTDTTDPDSTSDDDGGISYHYGIKTDGSTGFGFGQDDSVFVW